jgi:hypothetical protein
MYDTRGDRVVARRLATAPPFDAGTAASVALIVKTLLRHSEVPPPAERVEEPRDEPWLHIGLLAGARLPPISDGSVEPRVGLRVIAWPHDLGGWLGAGVEATLGPGLAVDGPRLRGDWTETALLASIHGRLALGSGVELGLAGGAGIHLTSLNGAIVAPPQTASETSINVSASAHGEVGWWLSPVVRLGLRLGLVHPFRTQTYLVRGETALETKSPIVDGMLVCDFGLL